MSIRNVTFAVLVCAGCAVLGMEMIAAQAPARGAAPAQGGARGRGAAATGGQQVQGDLLQVMQGILFPNSNVVFSAQTQDPGAVKKDADPTSSVNPLAGMYGGWKAIENSGVAMAEAANLLTLPGRLCSNGKPVPVQNADWQQFVVGLRQAGMATLKAGQSKNMDQVVEVSDTVATSCQNCHDVYREKTPSQGGVAARCTK